MPLSKPVKKVTLLLPSQTNFLQLSRENKENVLQRLTIDNLINYLEYIVNGCYMPTKTDCIMLEQIVEDEFKLGTNLDSSLDFISEWLAKNAERISNLESSNLFEQGNSSLAIQSFLNSPQIETRRPSVFQDLSNFPANFATNRNNMIVNCAKPVDEIARPIVPNTNSSCVNIQRRMKNAWENVNLSSNQNRWQVNLVNEKENSVNLVSTAAADRLPITIDIPFNSDSTGNPTLNSNNPMARQFVNNNFSTLGKPNYSNDSFIDSNNQNFGEKSRFPQYKFSPTKSESAFDMLNNNFSNLDKNGSNGFGDLFKNVNSPPSMHSVPFNSFGFNEYKPGKDVRQSSVGGHSFSQSFNQLFDANTNSPNSSMFTPDVFSTPMNRSVCVGDAISFANSVTNKLSHDSFESINLNLKDSEVFKSFNLPEPQTFNAMSAESRANLLESLPSTVKNKYQLFCWSFAFNQLIFERPKNLV